MLVKTVLPPVHRVPESDEVDEAKRHSLTKIVELVVESVILFHRS